MKNSTHGFLARLGVWAVGLALGILMVAPVKAEVLVTHAPDFGGSSYLSSLDAGAQNADFAFGGNASVTGIRWWGTTLAGVDLGLFTVRILSGLGDTFVLESVASPSQNDLSNGFSRFDLDLSTTPLLLGSGSFYLSIMNESTDDPGWAWLLGAGGDGINQFREVDGDPWQNSIANDGDFALELTGTRNAVPEPGTTALLLLAGAALVATRRQVIRRW